MEAPNGAQGDWSLLKRSREQASKGTARRAVKHSTSVILSIEEERRRSGRTCVEGAHCATEESKQTKDQLIRFSQDTAPPASPNITAEPLQLLLVPPHRAAPIRFLARPLRFFRFFRRRLCSSLQNCWAPSSSRRIRYCLFISVSPSRLSPGLVPVVEALPILCASLMRFLLYEFSTMLRLANTRTESNTGRQTN